VNQIPPPTSARLERDGQTGKAAQVLLAKVVADA
jgi:hypothetical protein